MINPFIPYGIKGFLWYQGEANAGNAALYKTMQPLLFNDWRNRWGLGNLPFLFVQLPNIKGKSWQWIREAQAFSLTYPNTGMAVSIDVGDRYDIHPHNKQPIGERLALQAEHMAYHEKLIYSGPTFDRLGTNGNSLTISFKNTGSGLVLKNTLQDSGFFIAGDDHVFHPADARISGTSIILSSPLIKKPVVVRYAWDSDPNVTLFNKKGLPAAPFRTDNWEP
jgi:sialate O-acetylesterase